MQQEQDDVCGQELSWYYYDFCLVGADAGAEWFRDSADI